jgi:hypothetical protein
VLASNERLEAEVAALRSEVEAVRALPASERPAAVEGGQRVGESPGESPGEGQGAAQGQRDGVAVRVVRWLEQRLRGRVGAG